MGRGEFAQQTACVSVALAGAPRKPVSECAVLARASTSPPHARRCPRPRGYARMPPRLMARACAPCPSEARAHPGRESPARGELGEEAGLTTRVRCRHQRQHSSGQDHRRGRGRAPRQSRSSRPLHHLSRFTPLSPAQLSGRLYRNGFFCFARPRTTELSSWACKTKKCRLGLTSKDWK